MSAYDERTDAVIYHSEATAVFERADWLRLAMACLDQAGLTVDDQARVEAILAEYRVRP